ncbi:isochorismate synthase [Bacillus massilinigeriensis]|uniref:isochorismate synthase n=1 Tax=Bacillus mediterraneensis TaxID=1805474 RepID=UPI0008F95D59|nr:isochorismate synthase [Bacillus mediterraneensis]
MVTIHDTSLKEGIVSGIRKAQEMNQPVLVSEVQRIDRNDAFAFFHAGSQLFLGERFFWKDPESRNIFAGVGTTAVLQHFGNEDRFTSIEEAWKSLRERAIILSDEEVAGTGPVLFGGFSFDPLKDKTGLWARFADSQFQVPKYLLTVSEGQAYLTSNILCSWQDEAEKLYQQFLLEKAALTLETTGTFPTVPSLEEIEEVRPEEWKNSILELVQELRGNDLQKVVLARELRLRYHEPIMADSVLHNLLEEQEGSFIFALEAGDDCFIGATPERLIKKEGNSLFSACLAGSIGRSDDPGEDERLGKSLLEDQKNLIEHQYVVDMIRAAMEATCEKVDIPESPQLMKMKYIQHLYTPVIGTNKEGTSIFQIIDRLHPTPALGGMPQRQAVEKIREVEILDRGYYAAPMGWLDHRGNGEFAVAIRSGLLRGKEASLFAGCGIVSDSDADSEYRETNIKFRPMLHALGGGEK